MAKKVVIADIAQVGDIISWIHNDKTWRGKVIAVYKNSVVVEVITHEDCEAMEFENFRTVVSHQRYEIIRKQ
jgi:uncharacterized protein YkvS